MTTTTMTKSRFKNRQYYRKINERTSKNYIYKLYMYEYIKIYIKEYLRYSFCIKIYLHLINNKNLNLLALYALHLRILFSSKFNNRFFSFLIYRETLILFPIATFDRRWRQHEQPKQQQ